MEKKRKNKIRKWDEVGGAVEVEEEVLSESPTEDPGSGPSVSRNFMRGIEDIWNFLPLGKLKLLGAIKSFTLRPEPKRYFQSKLNLSLSPI